MRDRNSYHSRNLGNASHFHRLPKSLSMQIILLLFPIKKRNSRKSVRWSAVPVAPKLVYVRCEGERGSGPEGADDLCWVRI